MHPRLRTFALPYALPYALAVVVSPACSTPSRAPVVARSQTPAASPRAPERAPPPAAAVDSALENAPLPPGARVTFNLQEATVAAALRTLSNLTGRSIVATPDASPLLECATLTIISSQPVTPARAEELVIEALRGSALTLTTAGTTLRIERNPAVAPPAICGHPPPASSSTASAPAPVPPPPPVDEQAVLARVHRGITETSPTEHTITEDAMNAVFEHQAILMRTTRVMPAMRGGRVTGIQLFGVSPRGILYPLGFRNGDVVQTINGLDISTPDHALEAYVQIRNASLVTARVLRAGSPVDLRIHITRP